MIYKNSNLWLNYLGFEGMKSLCSYDIRLLRNRRLLHKSNNEKYDSRVCCELQRHVRKANHMLITPNGFTEQSKLADSAHCTYLHNYNLLIAGLHVAKFFSKIKINKY